MWFEQHPYISLYLLGSVLAVVLILFNLLLFWAVGWITKGNILAKNLKKLEEPGTNSPFTKIIIFSAGLLFEAALSWINVFFSIWKTFAFLFRTLREALTPVPEEIKMLRFPLRNNPSMSRESVWAYCCALTIRAGSDWPSASDIQNSLDELAYYHNHINRKAALEQLSSLNVVSPVTIKELQEFNDSQSNNLWIENSNTND